MNSNSSKKIIWTYQKAFDKACKILTIRPHSEFEIKQKLFKLSISHVLIAQIMNELHRLHYIDDRTTAFNYMNELLSKGKGLKIIQQKLKAKQFSEDIIQEICIHIKENESDQESFSIMANQKWNSLQKEKDPCKKKEKFIRFLLGRGFSFEQIKKFLNQVNSNLFDSFE